MFKLHAHLPCRGICHCRLFLPAQLRALQEQKAGQVKVVYALRGAFELLDYEDASITDLKRMLLQVRTYTGR